MRCVALPCVALPCLALPCLALPCLALLCVAARCRASLCLALFCHAPASECTHARNQNPPRTKMEILRIFWYQILEHFRFQISAHTRVTYNYTTKHMPKHDVQRKQKCEHYYGARRRPCQHTLAKHASCRVDFARQYTTLAATPIAESRHNARGADGIHYAQVWCSLRLQKRLPPWLRFVPSQLGCTKAARGVVLGLLPNAFGEVCATYAVQASMSCPQVATCACDA